MLSDIQVSELIKDIEADVDGNVLTSPEKIEVINTSGQEVSTIYFNNKKNNYKKTNLASPIPATSAGVDERRGFASASMTGTFVPFSTPFALPYMLSITGYKNGQIMGADQFEPLTGLDTRTAAGFTAFAPDDGVTIEYRAYKPL